MEAAAALAVVALAIVGLAGIDSTILAAIAVIIFGAAILTEGGATAGLFSGWSSKGNMEMEARAGGMSAEFLGGVGGIVLGVLALLNLAPTVLLSVAAIGFGAAYLLNGLTVAPNSFFSHASGGQVLVGVAALVLGIVAVCGDSSLTLVLVSLLVLAAGALFSGATTGVRAASTTTQFSS